jgi:flagella basal body P-ring formation protein FlgA
MGILTLLLAGVLLGAAPPESTPAPAPRLAEPPAAEPVAGSPQATIQGQALAYVEAQAAGLSGVYTFKVLKNPLLPKAQGGELQFEPSHLSKRDLTGQFFASFKVTCGGRPLGLVRVDLEGKWVGKLLRTRNALARKTVPAEDQLEEMDFEGAPPAGALSALPEGFRLRAALPSGHILLRNDLEAVPVVLAGDRVRLELNDGGLSVAVETLARSNGAVGDRVRLELPASRKPLLGVVTGPGEAQAQWAGPK